MCDHIKFSVLCSLFNWMQRSKSSAKKRSKFRKFLDHYCKPGDYFGAIRLILPALDRERGSYGLKESVLATCLVDALGMSRGSEDAVRLFNWRKGGPKTGANAGNFSAVATEVLQRRQGITSGGLTVKELNDLLDCLASSENRAEKTSVLAEMIKKTNALEMKWIIMIILKDLKLGVSEKTIFHEFHPDAEDLFNVTCDLKLVCEKLWDRSQRHKRQDIEVGKPVRPQLAMRVSNAAAAWRKLHGKEIVLECKFDGDRIQIHKNGDDVHFFSRNFLDHPEYSHGMLNVVVENIQVDRCILDGEMLVWDTSTNRFAEFGSNQEIAKAAREGLHSERQLCYVAFDILYAGDSSVIHQSLKERQELLRKVVKPIKGRLEILVPNDGLNNNRHSGEPRWSILADNVDVVERFFKETVENRDEGIVLKDLGSKWEPGDRSGKWMKLKPEYVRAGADLDVLIIGGYYGSGRHGGQVAQFLVGLSEKASPNTYPRRFISFCRVGTGLSDDELRELVSRLKPYFRKNEPKKAAPAFYQVTNNSKERPDVWIENPEKSIILSITSDIRTIRSEVFAAPYSLRFPRIDSVRYDKPWHECLDVQSFVELVQSSNNTTQRTDYGTLPDDKSKHVKSLKRGDKNKFQVLPSHLVKTDVSNVKDETSIFSNFVFYFANMPPNYALDSLHKIVIENGGTFSMNLNDKVTHCIAAESKGIKYQAAQRRGDVIHYSWVLDCCLQKQLVYLQPKYFLFLSSATKKKLEDEIDEFCDSYFSDLNVAELKQIFCNASRSEDTHTVDYYKKKYWPRKWHLLDCCIYFRPVVQFCDGDWRLLLELEAKRLAVEILIYGGKVSSMLSNATHMVVLSVPGVDIHFETLLESLSREERILLRKKRLLVVQKQWIEDSVKMDQRLPEATYRLKPNILEEENPEEQCSSDERSKVSPVLHDKLVSVISAGAHIIPANRDQRRKRGRPSKKSTGTNKHMINQPRQLKARFGIQPAKIYEGEPKTNDIDINFGQVGPLDASTGGKSHRMAYDGNYRGIEYDSVRGFDYPDEGEKNKAEEYLSAPNDEEYRHSEIACRSDEYHEISHQDMTNSKDLDAMADPIQAMLLDMIPSLRMTNTEDVSTVEEKLPLDSQRVIPSLRMTNTEDVSAVEKLPLDSKPGPSAYLGQDLPKKKKISYKDLAAQLLKD